MEMQKGAKNNIQGHLEKEQSWRSSTARNEALL